MCTMAFRYLFNLITKFPVTLLHISAGIALIDLVTAAFRSWGVLAFAPWLIDNYPSPTTDKRIKPTNDFVIILLIGCNGSSLAILKPISSNHGFRFCCTPSRGPWALQESLQTILRWFSSPEVTVPWIDLIIKMEVGLITEPNIVNPVVLLFHLAIKSFLLGAVHLVQSIFV